MQAGPMQAFSRCTATPDCLPPSLPAKLAPLNMRRSWILKSRFLALAYFLGAALPPNAKSPICAPVARDR